MEFSSTKAMTMRRIEGGILGNLTDMTSDMTPFDAGIGGFVDLGKHSFIGKEALVEREKRCRLFGLTCKTKIPSSEYEGGFEVPSSVRPRIKMIRERIKTSSCRRLPAAFLGCYIAVIQNSGCNFQADF